MFKNIFDKGLLDFNLADISKIRKDMENKRIEMSAMDFMSIAPLSFVIDDYSDKEKTGALKFAAAVVYLNTTGEGKMMLDAYMRRMKEKLSEKLAQTEIPPRKHSAGGFQKRRACGGYGAGRNGEIQVA